MWPMWQLSICGRSERHDEHVPDAGAHHITAGIASIPRRSSSPSSFTNQ